MRDAELMSALSPDVVTTLVSFGSATLYEAQGQAGALDPVLKPLDPAARLAGPALTVDAVPGDSLVIHLAVTKAKPGDVLVVGARGETETGLWGDILTVAAQQRGIAGLVVDGAVRDADAIVETGFPVFSRGIFIRAARKNQPGKVNAPIRCGGVHIEPGDIIVGDRDGLVVIPRRKLDQTLEAALSLQTLKIDSGRRFGREDSRSIS